MIANGEKDMPPQVLQVEDCSGDVRLTQEAFRDANMSVQLHVASDGVEAMAFLRKAERNGSSAVVDGRFQANATTLTIGRKDCNQYGSNRCHLAGDLLLW